MNPEIPEDDSREITITKETITDEEKLLISETIEKKTIGEIKKEELSKFKLQNPSNKYNLTSYLIPPYISPESKYYSQDSNEECFTLRFDETNNNIACGFSTGRLGLFKLNNKNPNKKNILFSELSEFPITCLRWKPHNKTILLCVTADGLIYEIHSSSGKILQKLEEKNNPLMCVDYSIDGSLFATGGNDKVVKLYDDSTKTLISKLESKKSNMPEHSNRIFSVKFNPNNENMLISGGWDNTLLFYDIRAKEVQNFSYGAHICGDGMDIKDNYLLTVSWEKKDQIQLWDLRMMKYPYIFQVELPNENKNQINDISFLYSCKFNPKNSTFCISGSNKNLIRVYDYKNLTMKKILPVCNVDNMDFASYCCDYTSDGKMLSYGCADSMVRLVNIK